MGTIHMGHEVGLTESWQRDRGLHELAEEWVHIRAAEDAHDRARRGEAVDWQAVIEEHIVR